MTSVITMVAGAVGMCVAVGVTAAPTYTAINLGNFGTSASGLIHAGGAAINDAGQATGLSSVYDGNGNYKGDAAFLYSGGQLINLGNFGSDTTGLGRSRGGAINNAGQITGQSGVYDGNGNYKGDAAFLYSGGQLMNLGNFGSDATGYGYSAGGAINDTGQVTGFSSVYDGNGNPKGTAAFLYSDGQMVNLGNFGTDTSGYGFSNGVAINNAGQVTGFSDIYDDSGNYKGAASFLYSGSQLVNLGNFGTDVYGYGNSNAIAINNAGQVTGNSAVYDGNGIYKGAAAFLYSGGQLVNLGNFGTTTSGFGLSFGIDINDAGQVTGVSHVYDGNGNPMGTAAFLYSGGQLVNLGNFGSYAPNDGHSVGVDIADDGTVVGYASFWNGSSQVREHAAVSLDGGAFLDLNTLTSGLGTYELTSAQAVNDVGQILAYGCDQSGGAGCRTFLLTPDIAPPVPEPSTYALFGLGLAVLTVKCRRKQ